MAHEFKQGDKVRAVEAKQYEAPHALTIGKEYEVVENDGFVRVQNDLGKEEGYYPDRFEPAPKRFGKDEHIPTGAKIRCVDPVGELVLGQVYTVESMNWLSNVVLKGMGDGGFYPSRFELVELPKPEPELKALTLDEVKKLQPGQRLICVTQTSHGTTYDLKVGGEYEVFQNCSDDCVVVRGPGAPSWGIYGDRFALAPKAGPQPLTPDDIPNLKPGQKLLCLDAGDLGKGFTTWLTNGKEYEFVGTVSAKDHVKVRDNTGDCAYYVQRFALAPEPEPTPEPAPVEPEAPETVIVLFDAAGKPAFVYADATDVPLLGGAKRRAAVYMLVDVGHVEQQKLFVADEED